MSFFAFKKILLTTSAICGISLASTANAEMDYINIGAAAGTGSIIVDNMKIFSDSATEKTYVDFINNSAD